MTKIITFYLPQFHTFPENDRWWGKGFTEWRTVKSAKKLYKEHNQPRNPLDANYYCLNDNGDTMKWQADLAKEYGVYGFCFYHYWFDGKMLMEKPMEIWLDRKDIDLHYCICWANENWTRAWADKTQEILIEQHYGDRNDWTNHFNYFLKFFKDDRYIVKDNKPVLVIYRPELITTRYEMLEYWNELAKANGFDGLFVLYQQNKYNPQKDAAGKFFDAGIEYQPQYAMDLEKSMCHRIPYNIYSALNLMTSKMPAFIKNRFLFRFSYDKLWTDILTKFPQQKKMYPGAFVDWDNTPRHKNRGSFCTGVTPDKFKKYLTQQIRRTEEVYGKDMLFMFAWNEWGEGGYLEPDTTNKYKMLEAIRESLNANRSN